MFPGSGVRLDVNRLREMAQPSRSAWPKECGLKDCAREVWQRVCAPEHICYRTKISLPLDLYRGRKLVDMKYAEVINAWDIGAISVTRAFLVHKITKLRFQNGVLVSAIVRKPSEVEELSLLPIHVLNAALITPSGLWAAAFTANAADESKMLQDMNSLATQVQGLNAKIDGLVTGTGADLTTGQATENYALDCREAQQRSVSINLLQ